MKLLIAYDGSKCAEDALDDLARAGLPRAAEALVLTVSEVWLPQPASAPGVAQADIHSSAAPAGKSSKKLLEAQELAARAGDRLRSMFPAWSVRAEAATGSAPTRVLEKADEWGPDLIVVGSHGRSALGRFVIGSVSQKIVTEARTSVRVARGSKRPAHSPVRLIIGVDGTHNAELAVRADARRWWPAGSEVRLITSMEPLRIYGQYGSGPESATVAARESLQAAEKILHATDLKISSAIKEGDPKRILVSEAATWKADCIFVGVRGHSLLDRFLLGSVSAAVAQRARCSVEVVRATTTPRRPRRSSH